MAARQRPLVNEEAQPEVVEGEVGEVLGKPPAYAQPLTQLADDPRTGAVMADEQDSTAFGFGAGLRLSEIVEERGEAQRAAASELVGERLGEHPADLLCVAAE